VWLLKGVPLRKHVSDNLGIVFGSVHNLLLIELAGFDFNHLR